MDGDGTRLGAGLSYDNYEVVSYFILTIYFLKCGKNYYHLHFIEEGLMFRDFKGQRQASIFTWMFNWEMPNIGTPEMEDKVSDILRWIFSLSNSYPGQRERDW